MLWSRNMKTVVLIELTCPAEEGIQNASVRKQERYADLKDLIRNNDWTHISSQLKLVFEAVFVSGPQHYVRALGRSTHFCRKVISIHLPTLT